MKKKKYCYHSSTNEILTIARQNVKENWKISNYRMGNKKIKDGQVC